MASRTIISLILGALLSLGFFSSCEKEGNEGNFTGTGTYSYDGTQRNVKSAWWASTWDDDIPARVYFLTYNTDGTLIGADEPEAYVVLYITGNIMDRELDLLNAATTGEYYTFQLELSFDRRTLLTYSAVRKWDNDRNEATTTVTTGDGQRLDAGKIKVTTNGDGFFTLEMDVTVNGKSIRSTLSGNARHRPWS